jgi:hypothetical protein
MCSDHVVDREAITAAFDALERAVGDVAAVSCDALTTPERLALLERLHQGSRNRRLLLGLAVIRNWR